MVGHTMLLTAARVMLTVELEAELRKMATVAPCSYYVHRVGALRGGWRSPTPRR